MNILIFETTKVLIKSENWKSSYLTEISEDTLHKIVFEIYPSRQHLTDTNNKIKN